MAEQKLQKFDVAVYNKRVRDFVRRETPHPHFHRGWAEIRYFEIEAFSAEEAMEVYRRKYPENKGFIVQDALKIKEYMDFDK